MIQELHRIGDRHPAPMQFHQSLEKIQADCLALGSKLAGTGIGWIAFFLPKGMDDTACSSSRFLHLGHFEGRYAFGSDQLLCLLQVVCLDLPGKAFSLRSMATYLNLAIYGMVQPRGPRTRFAVRHSRKGFRLIVNKPVGITNDFVEGREPSLDLFPTAPLQSAHPFFEGDLPDIRSGSIVNHQSVNGVAHLHQFENTHPPSVSEVLTFLTTDGTQHLVSVNNFTRVDF